MSIRKLLYILLLCLLIPNVSLAVKRALIVGVSSYPAGSGWCHLASDNDVMILRKAFFDFKDIQCLIDENATKYKIGRAFDRLVGETQPGDTVIVHFSGHGQQMKTSNMEERDGLDEAFIPYDAQKAKTNSYHGEKHLTDNELSEYINSLRNKAGVNGFVLVTLDACHSGDMNRGLDEKDNYIIRGSSEIFGVDDDELRDSLMSISDDDTTRIEKNNQADVLYLSACGQHEVNREIVVDSVSYGSLSYCVFVAYSGKGVRDISDFVNAVLSNMKVKMPFQTPRIRSSIEIRQETGELSVPEVLTKYDKISYRSIVLVLLGALVLVTLICLLWRMRKRQ